MGGGMVMRFLHILIAVVLLAVFLRPDTQLLDIVLETHLIWSGGAALFLIGLLFGRFSARWSTPDNSGKIAALGLVVVLLLGLVEYSTEWRKSTILANNQTVTLSAASAESVNSHFIKGKAGLFRTRARVNGIPADMLVDTGATLVLLTWETAQNIGIDMGELVFDEPVISATGSLEIALVTLAELAVGNISLRNVAAAVAPKGQSQSNLLGGSFLSRLDSVVFKNNAAVLRQRR